MLFFGIVAGLPLLLIFSSLSLWLREAGVDRSAVTYFSWAALGYSFACPETSLTFVAIWYTAGIVLAGLVGRVLGPVVLRW
jgi:hypothetical protein